MGRIQGKVAVITGAASGMGRATAIRFAKEGAAVVVADLNSQGGELVVSEIAAAKGRAVFQRTDVISEDDIKALINRAVKEYGRLDITYNNAGVGGHQKILELPVAEWDRVMAVNARGTFLCSKAVLPGMIARRWGRIVSLSSGVALSPGWPATILVVHTIEP